MSRTRFLLCRSASRPINGVAATAASRFAVTAQLTPIVDAFNWSAMMPSTGTTAVCRTATVRTTMLSPGTSSRWGCGMSPDVVDRVGSVSTTHRSDR